MRIESPPWPSEARPSSAQQSRCGSGESASAAGPQLAERGAGMGRRGATLLLGAVLLLLLIWQAGTAPVPYVELGPGPTENTLGSHDGKPIITIDGRAETASAGQLRLTTVNV